MSLIFGSGQKQGRQESLAEIEFLTRVTCDPQNSITHPQEIIMFAKRGRHHLQR